MVEDEAPIRDLLRLHLDLHAFDVAEERDGRQALATARAMPFDLILLDVMLPDLDGVSVCRALRAAGANRETPILMLTARDGEADTVLGPNLSKTMSGVTQVLCREPSVGTI